MIVYPDLGQHGRIGNQMWEVASTMGLAFARNDTCFFPTDWSYRPFFSVPDWFFDDTSYGTHAADLCRHVDERHRVYLQDYGYWADHAGFIRRIFQPSERAQEDLELIQSELLPGWVPSEWVALHVRRGDNVISGPEYYIVPDVDYYRRALELVPADAPVLVLSDDITWCRSNLLPLLVGREHLFYQGVTRPKEHEPEYTTAPVLDHLDMMLGALCGAGSIGSNSTYGWWVAFLAGTERPIFPKPWYGSRIDYADADKLFPKDWIRI